MGKKRDLRLTVHGVRRKEPDTRRMARAVLRLAVELDTDQAAQLTDALDNEEALRQLQLSRARSAQRQDSDGPKDRTRRRAS